MDGEGSGDIARATIRRHRIRRGWFLFDRVDLPEGVTETFAKAWSVRSGETLLREDERPA
jgi:hypothetical protein